MMRCTVRCAQACYSRDAALYRTSSKHQRVHHKQVSNDVFVLQVMRVPAEGFSASCTDANSLIWSCVLQPARDPSSQCQNCRFRRQVNSIFFKCRLSVFIRRFSLTAKTSADSTLETARVALHSSKHPIIAVVYRSLLTIPPKCFIRMADYIRPHLLTTLI